VKLYAFDVDETLEISGGPIKLDQMTQLRNEGHIVGICGNWIIFVQAVTGWHDLVSFLSIGIGEKSEFLNQIKQYIRAEEYIMVGRRERRIRRQGCSGDGRLAVHQGVGVRGGC